MTILEDKKQRNKEQLNGFLTCSEEYCSVDNHDLDPVFSFHR